MAGPGHQIARRIGVIGDIGGGGRDIAGRQPEHDPRDQNKDDGRRNGKRQQAGSRKDLAGHQHPFVARPVGELAHNRGRGELRHRLGRDDDAKNQRRAPIDRTRKGRTGRTAAVPAE
ncbi:hypothetical protein GCM10017635_19400 [Paracoccus kondratievae]|uniref:Uncharacterized protein n=1 Tax=Paracoccus kondratievae TaxID=135740 RepID=A0AAD3RU94_9RHOB|nr:hypothetical protein [Paracoccus kondratievae]GLK64469.1 hypothetical protein GCM10017635_19400 [Paracoccus kondratievae]